MASSNLDLLFVLDTTASQGPYIDTVVASVETICADILNSDKIQLNDLRIGLIAFRDHIPQDFTFVTCEWNFTKDVKKILGHLKRLQPSGGGDLPEAITAALHKALHMDWGEDCTKIVVLISDAPPHGIGSDFDGFPDGVPGDEDPLAVAKKMAASGITLHFVACEPDLSSQRNATEFYRALTRITSGISVPLTAAKSLTKCIIGSVLETRALEELTLELDKTLSLMIDDQKQRPRDVVAYLFQLLSLRKKLITQLYVEPIYKWERERIENVHIWSSARNIAEARSQLKNVDGTPFHSAAGRHFNPFKYVKICFRNLSNDHVKVTWYDKNGNIKLEPDGKTPTLSRSFPPSAIQDLWMEVHEIQKFRLEQSHRVKEDERAFTRHGTYELGGFFL